MNHRSRLLALVVALALPTAQSLTGTGGVAAGQSPVHVVELVDGSCDVPVGPASTLWDLSAGADPADAPPGMGAVVEALGPSVSSGHIAVPISLQDLILSGHAVRIVQQDRPPGRLVACGEFGSGEGPVSDVQLGLAPIDGSGLQGVAWLHDDGDGTTAIFIAVAAQAPVAAGAEVEVVIRKSLYVPNPLEIPVGTTVTWVNEDALPHTTTATGGAFDSGYMPRDARFSQTFVEPGEYAIFCAYHPRMRSVVIVS